MSHKITEPYAQIPTLFKKEKFTYENIGHKITEPYAQIPTQKGLLGWWGFVFVSQNNRALRSNPNVPAPDGHPLLVEIKSHKITEPYAQIPTELVEKISNHIEH